MNSHAYVRNNPVNRSDPTGLFAYAAVLSAMGPQRVMTGALISSGVVGLGATLSLHDSLTLRNLELELIINEFEGEIYGTSRSVVASSIAAITRFGEALFSHKQGDAIEKAVELVPAIYEHFDKLMSTTGGPNDSNNHWSREIRTWLRKIEKKTKNMKRNKREAWLRFVKLTREWLENPGSGAPPPVAPG